MAKRITVGIDIGTYQIKVVVAENILEAGHKATRIIGTGYAESKGLRHGYIINTGDAIQSIRQALDEAEASSGIKIRRAFVSIGGVGLSGNISQGSIAISRADSEITGLDMAKVLESAEAEIPSQYILNRKVIHAIPIQYKIDGKIVLGKPVGMKGMKFEVKALFITCLSHHLNDLAEAIQEAGVSIIDVMASPIAASFVTLNKTQKIAGCVLANIGAETVSIVVFENNIPISLEVFPIGGTDITNDIALGLKIPLEEAEQIKLGAITTTAFPKKKLDEIIFARLSDMFELIEAHLKKIGRNGLLPAGVIITGGSSGISTIEDFAKTSLRLPSRIAQITFGMSNTEKQIKDSSWSVAYGLCILGLNTEDKGSVGLRSILSQTRRSILDWIKQFLP